MGPSIKQAAVLAAAVMIMTIPSTGFSKEDPQKIAAEAAVQKTASAAYNETSTGQTGQPEKDLTQPSQAEEKNGESGLVGLPNPYVPYETCDAAAEALGFAPLSLPETAGWQCTDIFVIDNETADLRYGRKWEPEMSLRIRTFRLPEGEPLRDISGLYGVNWRTETIKGRTVYIARAEDRERQCYAASWMVGSYIFSTYGENMSYAPFWYLLSDTLLELSALYDDTVTVSDGAADISAPAK